MNKTQATLVLAAGIALGAGGSALKFPSASAAPAQFQYAKVYLRSLNTADGGTRPIYSGHVCAQAFKADGGLGLVECPDHGDLTPAEATAFEAFLASLGVAPPR